MILYSTAKINLFLDILGVDPADGYHYIDSVFQEISLHDVIHLEPSESDVVEFVGAQVEGKTTVHKALELFRQTFGVKDCFRVTVEKQIPLGAGLGGGSSNASFVLMGLADYYHIPRPDVSALGATIGSDVPYFFYGGLCRVSGKGEKIEPLTGSLQDVVFLVVYPGISVSTAWAYSLVKDYGKAENIDVFLKKSTFNIDFLSDFMYNKFQVLVLDNESRLADLKRLLDKHTRASFSLMSGSGSSFVYFYENEWLAQDDKMNLMGIPGMRAFVCRPVIR